jgi:hypothetical protein
VKEYQSSLEILGAPNVGSIEIIFIALNDICNLIVSYFSVDSVKLSLDVVEHYAVCFFFLKFFRII